MSASDSKRNSVSPPNSVRSSEEEPLDFSRATAEDSRESKGSDDKTSGAVTSTQCGDESGATTRLFLPSPSPRRDSSPQTSSSDMDPASDPLSKLPSPLMFGRTSLPTPLTAADLMQSSLDLLTPAFNPLYTFPFPVTQMDPALSPGYLDPDFMRYRQQQVLSQKLQQVSTARRKHVYPVSPPIPSATMTSPETMSEISEHSNDSQHISTSSPAPAPMTPTKTQSTGRRRGKAYPEEMKDEAYWERRRKNNEAAKRSRDARRAKEDQTAIRAALLEEEVRKLREVNTMMQQRLQYYMMVVGQTQSEKIKP